MKDLTFYLVAQVDKKGKVLGVRSISLSPYEVEMDLAEARTDFKAEIENTGWPIWKIVVYKGKRKCHKLNKC